MGAAGAAGTAAGMMGGSCVPMRLLDAEGQQIRTADRRSRRCSRIVMGLLPKQYQKVVEALNANMILKNKLEGAIEVTQDYINQSVKDKDKK